MPRRVPSPVPSRHFLKEWRLHRKLTLEQLAERAGTTKGHLSNIERNIRLLNHNVALSIAAALMIDEHTLRTQMPDAAIDDEAVLVALFRGATTDQRKVMLDMGRSIAGMGKPSG